LIAHRQLKPKSNETYTPPVIPDDTGAATASADPIDAMLDGLKLAIVPPTCDQLIPSALFQTFMPPPPVLVTTKKHGPASSRAYVAPIGISVFAHGTTRVVQSPAPSVPVMYRFLLELEMTSTMLVESPTMISPIPPVKPAIANVELVHVAPWSFE
jgi:hypothetical protein